MDRIRIDPEFPKRLLTPMPSIVFVRLGKFFPKNSPQTEPRPASLSLVKLE